MGVRALVVVLVLALATALGLAGTAPPAPVPASAPATEFSSARAMEVLAAIATRPHPTGTPADDEVRAYLVARLEALGFSVDVQDATSLTDVYAKRYGLPVVAAHVENVVARRKGTQPGPAVLLTAHYDSRELAPGASDDGYGTAALLETARALSASPPLRHDVVLVLTEGEEEGLLGAKAFVEESPVAREAGVVLNFEARGDAGPVSMFQSSEGAAGLVDVLAAAAPHLAASSLSQEVYRRMPNDTDLTVWLRAGYPGLNFANVGGFGRYHQPTDTVANVDPGTLQQHGAYALALARAFASRDVVPPRGGDEVYFSIGPLFVHYDVREGATLAWFACGLLAVAVGVGVWRKRLRPGRIALGAGVVLAAVVLGALAGEGAWWVADRASGGALAMPTAREALRTACAAGAIAVGAGLAWAVMGAAVRRGASEDVGLGAMVPWALMAVAAARWLPGGSYVVAWPLAAAAAAGCARVALRRVGSTHPAAIAMHLVAPALAALIGVPLALQLGVAFGPAAAPALAGLGALVVTTAVPQVATLARVRGWAAPVGLFGGGLAWLLAAAAAPPFDAQYPRPDSLVYGLDADHDAAMWLSTDPAPDGWNARPLTDASRRSLASFFPPWTTLALEAPAPHLALDTPRIGILEDTREGDARTLRLRVTLPPGTEIAGFAIGPEAHVLSASVQGKAFDPLPRSGWLDLAFFGPPPAGLALDLRVSSQGTVTLYTVAKTRGLPPSAAATVGPRPPDRMPAVVQFNPMLASDTTLVASSFQL
ncbi:MAG TPA: M28 family peptidase [Polyangiaceae bacterium]|jgi:hypothetical protein